MTPVNDLVLAAHANIAALAGHIEALASASPSIEGSTADVAKQLYRLRRARSRYIRADLFGEPGWDMLLDLYIARNEKRRVSTSSLCIAAAVPPTTALRWIARLEGEGVIRRYSAKDDKRLTLVEITDDAFDRLTAFFTATVKINPGA